VSAVFGEGGKNWRMLQGKANHRACLPKVVLIFLLVGRCGISSVCVIGRRIGCPKSQIVTQKLHDQRRVLVAILIKGVQLGNGLIKGLKSKKKMLKPAIDVYLKNTSSCNLTSFINYSLIGVIELQIEYRKGIMIRETLMKILSNLSLVFM